MHSVPTPPRHVLIGDVAAFAPPPPPRRSPPHHQIGLLPGREHSRDGRRRHEHDDVIRMLWIRRMADAGITLDNIPDASDVAAPGGADCDDEVSFVLDRMERALELEEAELNKKMASVRRTRRLGGRMGLLDDFVSRRLEGTNDGALRSFDLDTLLVTERTFGPLGAAL